MTEHSGLTVKFEEQNGSITWLGAVSVHLPPLKGDRQNYDGLTIEMESGERRYIDRGTAYIMNAGGKTIDRVSLDRWRKQDAAQSGEAQATPSHQP